MLDQLATLPGGYRLDGAGRGSRRLIAGRQAGVAIDPIGGVDSPADWAGRRVELPLMVDAWARSATIRFAPAVISVYMGSR
jgi:hypothetical protein